MKFLYAKLIVLSMSILFLITMPVSYTMDDLSDGFTKVIAEGDDSVLVRLAHEGKIGSKIICSSVVSHTFTEPVSPLFFVTYQGNVEAVRKIIPLRPPLDEENGGFTALYLAAQLGHTEIVNMLRRAGADVNFRNVEEGTFPLAIAALYGHATVVEELLQDERIQVNMRDGQNNTALEIAEYKGHVGIVRTLHAKTDVDLHNAGLEKQEPRGKGFKRKATLVLNTHFAASTLDALFMVDQADNFSLKDFMQQDKVRSKTISSYVQRKQFTEPITPLFFAANEDIDLAKKLITLGVPCEEENCGVTPLYRAAQCGHTELVHVLRRAGAQVNARKMDVGTFPLEVAAFYGHSTTVKELLRDPNIQVNMRDNDESTALYVAGEKGYKDIVGLLLAAGADPNIPGFQGKTPLLIAVCRGSKRCVNLLLDYGADPLLRPDDKENPEKPTVLVGAICGKLNAREKSEKFKKITKILIERAPALIDIPTEVSHKTALMVAADCHIFSVFKNLLRVGAHVQLQDEDNNTIFHRLTVGSQRAKKRYIKAAIIGSRCLFPKKTGEIIDPQEVTTSYINRMRQILNIRNKTGWRPMDSASVEYRKYLNPDTLETKFGNKIRAKITKHFK